MEPEEFKYCASTELSMHHIKRTLYAQACFTVCDLMRELEVILEKHQVQKEEFTGLRKQSANLKQLDEDPYWIVDYLKAQNMKDF